MLSRTSSALRKEIREEILMGLSAEGGDPISWKRPVLAQDLTFTAEMKSELPLPPDRATVYTFGPFAAFCGCNQTPLCPLPALSLFSSDLCFASNLGRLQK
ncbi:hypothetical protein CDAR_186091 [Caerostris darwini]|uniref:Uncharacterized protein n=1 Tax=Caerostris darwini TaxID=1538125 RepID=A0AAV4WC59_9ARAC|nr:hypothetical protein CDAR_186091 [Caerostris darwini]